MERPGSMTSVRPRLFTMSRTVSIRSVGDGSLVSGLRGDEDGIEQDGVAQSQSVKGDGVCGVAFEGVCGICKGLRTSRARLRREKADRAHLCV